MNNSSPCPIAVIGMSCRLPGGASNPEKLWDMLAEGRSGWGKIPTNRWNSNSFYHPNPEAKEGFNAQSGYFLKEDISTFDPTFFGIMSYEADGIDPQQRILLETTYEALENAGQTLESIQGSDTSVYVAAFARDYDRMGYKDISNLSKYRMTGTGEAILSNRISYVFDLKGASATVDTGCSGSIVALHQACQTLRTGESRMAIAGGTQLLLTPDQTILMSMVGMTNPDGKCYVFDSRGSGYARGEGVGTLILKRLEDALADGDPIHAVIRNTGLNQDGKTAGIHLPNGAAQSALMRSVYKSAGLDPRDTAYVEAHGTGTQAGDKAEIGSIYDVFCDGRNEDLLVGSIKSNIGHLEAASGMAGLMKAIMILKNQSVPPNIDLIHPKESLLLGERNITIPLELTPLHGVGPHRVSVNSFGYGGTNGHVILESAPIRDFVGNGRVEHSIKETNGENHVLANGVNGIHSTKVNGVKNPHGVNGSNGAIVHKTTEKEEQLRLFVLTAKSEVALRENIQNLLSWSTSEKNRSSSLRDLSYTLATRRSFLQWRYSFIASKNDELVAALGQKDFRISKISYSTRVVFLLNGQGAQWHAMGRELIKYNSIFRESILNSETILRSFGCTWSLTEVLSREESESSINQSELSQPACTALQIAIIDLLQSYGIKPQAVVGHSSGEIAAAYAAGVLSQQDAIKIAYYRGFVSNACKRIIGSPGAMLAVGAGENELAEYLIQTRTGLVGVACQNSPESTTVSGDDAAIDELSIILNNVGIWNRKLKVDTAYHSHHMRKVANTYASSLGDLLVNAPQKDVKFYSSVSGEEKTSYFGTAYWVENLVSKVRFSDALQRLCLDELVDKSKVSTSATINLFMEIGPHSTFAGPLRQIIKHMDLQNFQHSYIPTLVRGSNAIGTILKAVGKSFEHGYPVSVEKTTSIDNSEEGSPLVLGDLPRYSWDHTVSYWQESRLSRDHRLRPFPYHDLLGLKVVGSSTQEPVWRNHLSVDTLPWLRDHVVDGFMIFPGAGYLCMVVEAIKQIIQIRQTPGIVSRYLIRDIITSKALIIPEKSENSTDLRQAQVEIQLTLSPKKNQWESFRICSLSEDDTWSQHCSGSVMVEFASPVDEVEGQREYNFWQTANISRLERFRESCTQKLNPDDIYDDLKANGNVFGENFRLLTDTHIGGREGLATVIIPDVAACMPHKFIQPHVIHPTTLDAINQLSLPLYKQNCSSGPVMPVETAEVAISAELSSQPGTELLSALDISSKEKRSALVNTTVYQKGADSKWLPVITISDAQLRSIGDSEGNDQDAPFHRKMAYRMEWVPDIDFIHGKYPNSTSDTDKDSTISANNVLATEPDLSSPSEETSFIISQWRLYERATAFYVRRALKKTARDTIPKEHLIKLFDWMLDFVSSEHGENLIGGATDADEEKCLQEAAARGVEGEMLRRIGEDLPAILAGTTEPLSLMLEDGLLHKFYAESLVSSYKQMSDYVQLLAFKNPQMTILEIGAGTGGASLPMLKSLKHKEEFLLHRYHYTDISSGFFDGAKTLLQEWEKFIDFKTLDISLDPVEQGFSEASYDLIIASDVLHATKSLDETLSNVRRLLKPGGRLLLIELTRMTGDLSLIFGTLRDWWSFNDDRKDGPTMSEEQWRIYLTKQKFNGLEVSLGDFEGLAARNSMMVSQSALTSIINIAPAPSFEIVSEAISKTSVMFTKEFAASLVNQGLKSSVVPWKLHQVKPNTVYVILDDMEQPLLMDPTSQRFKQILHLVTSASAVLWISVHSDSTAHLQSVKGIVSGLARVARRENEGMQFTTLEIKDSLDFKQPELIRALTHLAFTSFCTANSSGGIESEYAYNNQQLLIPRVKTDHNFNLWVDKSLRQGVVQTDLFHQETRPLKLHVETPGMLNSLMFVDDTTSQSPLGHDEIEIETKAFGVNFKDVFIAMGQMLPGVKMAGECAGVVTRVGSGLQDRFRVHDRVCAAGAIAYSSRARVFGNNAFQLPHSMSYAAGASIPIVFLTAYYCLVEVARLKKNQTVLIHAAAGGVGQAAMMIAQSIGAEIFATVGSTAKKSLLMEKYDLPESHIFSSRTRSFKQGILRLTQNKGVDVVLNSLSGESLEDSWACIALMGTFVEIGKADIYKKSSLAMDPFDRHVTFAAVDLTLLFDYRSEEMAARFTDLMKMFENGILKPVEPITIMEMTEIEGAFRLIQSRKHMGKVIVEANEKTMVNVVPAKPRPLRLDANATYVVAGGLGDLGRRICRLLASYGAKHIATFSRRALDKVSKKAFEDELSSLGAKIHIIQCDISDAKIVQEVAFHFQATLPPVKGVIHAGMVLRDHPLEQMTFEDYMAAIKPKVHGTRNIDAMFSSNSLEFFIMLSSITCIVGKSGQANYAAGNAFQDAFAHTQSEAKPHTRYISLNLGAIEGSDAINSLPLLQQELMWQESVLLMKFKELFMVMEYSMGSQAKNDHCVQMILGIDREMMGAVQDTFALENPLFSHLPYTIENGTAASKSADTIDVVENIKNSQTLDEAQAIIINEIAKKIALLIGCLVDEINMEVSIADFGLDSLIAIELKNWIARTFQAAMQTAEIFGSTSIIKLAMLVATRSTLVSVQLKESTSNATPAALNSEKPEQGLVESKSHKQICCRYVEKLPEMPLLGLDDALQLLRESVRHLSSDKEFAELEEALQDFQQSNSIGRQLYDRLVQRTLDPKIDNWDYDLYLNHHYLKSRDPVWSHAGNYLAMHNPTEVQHGQAERAALIASSAFKYKQAAESHQLEPFQWLGTPACMYMHQWLFNSHREPRHGCDELRKFPGNDYVAVLRHGHVFKVMLREGNENVSYQKLRYTFQSILNKSLECDSWVGILATDERDSWAETRAVIKAANPLNEEYLSVIEAAAFILCLDDGSPTSTVEWANMYYMGDGFNRWDDAAVQFCVANNGTSGTCINHTMADGLIFHGMNEWIVKAIHEHKPETHAQNGISNDLGTIDPYTCVTTPAIDRHILKARAGYLAATSSREFAVQNTSYFGKDFLLAHKVPVKGIFDILIQLAGRLYFGYSPASWEAISHANFHKGRPDMLQVCTSSVVKFCDSAFDDHISSSSRRQMLLQATTDYGNVLKHGANTGPGYRQIFCAMSEMREEGEPLPRVFTDPAYLRHERQILVANFADDSCQTSVHFLPDPESVWMMYHISDEGAEFSIVAPRGQTDRFRKCLGEAAKIIKVLIEVE